MTPKNPPKYPPKNLAGRPFLGANRKILGKQAKSAFWRIVIPSLTQYNNSTPQELNQLKIDIKTKLLEAQTKRQLRYYKIAIQSHKNGDVHLDILIAYTVSIQRRLTDFDYLLKHGNVTTYRRLNEAIIDYGSKQDPSPLTNMPKTSSELVHQLERHVRLKKDPYLFLQNQMKKDPFNFDLAWYATKNDLFAKIKGWTSIKTKLKDSQEATCNLQLQNKPGFKFITRKIIQESLDSKELALYDSWPGYQFIVDHLNQIPTYGTRRPMKTPNLYLYGPAGVGKTSFITQPNHQRPTPTVSQLTSVYIMGMRHWFPAYKSHVNNLIFWDQATFTSYAYPTILKFLQGTPIDLPYHGGATKKIDNPLIIMTSNNSLMQTVAIKFPSPEAQEMARDNLKPRINAVHVTSETPLFILRKLLKPA